MPTRLRWATLLTGALLTGMTACSPGSGDPAGPSDTVAGVAAPASTAAATPRATPTRAHPDPPTPTPSSTRTTAPANPAPARTVTAPACATVNLAVSVGESVRGVGGVVGRYATPIHLRNTSQNPCSLDGWAGLSLFGDTTMVVCNGPVTPGCGKPVSTTEPRSTTVTRAPNLTPAPVELAPGAETSYDLLWTLAGVPDCGTTNYWAPPYGAQIWIPGGSAPLLLTPLTDIQACEGAIQLTPIGVTVA